MNEIWKDVRGREGEYMVSNMGRVKNISYLHKSGKIVHRDKILKLFVHPKGYIQVDLRKGGKKCVSKVHRLVLSAFTEEHNDLQVNHINGIKSDNRLENLEWVTNAENVRHAIRTGLLIPHTPPKRNGKEVEMLKDGAVYKTYPSVREMCREEGLNNGNVTCCLNGRRHHRTVKGFTFRYTGREINLNSEQSNGFE